MQVHMIADSVLSTFVRWVLHATLSMVPCYRYFTRCSSSGWNTQSIRTALPDCSQSTTNRTTPCPSFGSN